MPLARVADILRVIFLAEAADAVLLAIHRLYKLKYLNLSRPQINLMI